MKIKKAISVIITIIVSLALGVVLQEIFNTNGWLTLFALAQSSIIIFSLSKFLDWHFKTEDKVNSPDEKYIINCIKDALIQSKKDTCKLCEDGFENENFGIIKSDDLPHLERRCSNEVWILASDLHTEKRKDVKELVTNNLKRGINYKYFISNNYSVIADAKDLISEFSSNISNSSDYEFYFIDDDYFFFIDGLDIVIYDPMELDCYKNLISDTNQIQQGRRAYVSILSQKDNIWYEVPLSDDLIDQIILMAQKYMSEVTPIRKA